MKILKTVSEKRRTTIFFLKIPTSLANTLTGIELHRKENSLEQKNIISLLTLNLSSKENVILETVSSLLQLINK